MQGEKKSFVARVARWSASHRKLAIWGWVAFVVVAVLLGKAVGKTEMTEADKYSGESGRAEQALSSEKLVPNTEMVLVKGGEGFGSPEFNATVKELTTKLAKAPYVRTIYSPLDHKAPVSRDGQSALVEYDVAGNLDQAEERVDSSRSVVDAVAAEHPDLEVSQYGPASSYKDMKSTIENDLHKAEQISMPITLAILVLAFGALVAAGLPMLLAITGVAAAMALVALPSGLISADENVNSIILLVGLAVGVDYSLFYLRRDREERAKGKDPKTALEIASETSGHAVLVSGLTVIAAMGGMYLTGDKTFMSLATGSVMVVAISMIASITVLPALMAWLGPKVDRGQLPVRRFMAKRGKKGPGVWSVVVDRVMRRPVLATALAGGALLALSIPALGLNTKVTSANDLPRDVKVMQTYDQIQATFPGQTAKAEVVVQAGDVRHGEVAAQIAALEKRAGRSDLIADPITTAYSADGTTALLDMPIVGSGSDGPSMDAVTQLRDELIPATVGKVDGAEANVSGEAAKSIDSDSELSSAMPKVFAFVLGLTFILMLVTFRSIVIPIGTIVLNMLSVGAAYGLLVLIFQNGWGESILGFTSNGGITSWLPLFLFVILFGLSMDYHVFILSRVREAHDRGLSTDEAVRTGITSTAGTVTSAAIVMVAVFLTFATLTFVDMKEMGIGLAAAVLIDATVIRGVLLPAGMKLLGDRTWYMPKWLDRSRRAGGPEPHAEPARA